MYAFTFSMQKAVLTALLRLRNQGNGPGSYPGGDNRMRSKTFRNTVCYIAASLFLAAAMSSAYPAAAMAFTQTDIMKAAPDLLKKAKVSNVDELVKKIDHIISATESGTYANNSWQLLKEDKTGTVRTIRAHDYQMWSATAELCREYGYKEAIAYFYYDNPDVSDELLSSYGPICISADIDGDNYKYYFIDNKMIRRIGPDGTQNNPATNSFLNSLYKLGVEYKKPGTIVKVGTFELVISSLENVHERGRSFLVKDSRSPSGYYVIDDKTEIALFENNEPYVERYIPGDSGFTWFKRLYDDKNYGSMSALGVYLVYPTGNHIDLIYDTYWWD